MRVFDTFMFFNEVDMLLCRLMEMNAVVDQFILVESTETHQGQKKPSYYLENKDRFKPWSEDGRILRIEAELGKTHPVEREREQREWTTRGLLRAVAAPGDIVLHSDVDEVPTAEAVRQLDDELYRNARRSPFIALEQRLCCFAVDWEYPAEWASARAARYGSIASFDRMRNGLPSDIPALKRAGSHLSWLGGPGKAVDKLSAFMHTEDSIQGQRQEMLSGRHYHEGYHVDGVKLRPVEVDASWPIYVSRRLCPPEWFRPRDEEAKKFCTCGANPNDPATLPDPRLSWRHELNCPHYCRE